MNDISGRVQCLGTVICTETSEALIGTRNDV